MPTEGLKRTEPPKPPRVTRIGPYILAAVITGACIALRPGLVELFGEGAALILLVLPILLSAYVGGLGPGILSTMMASASLIWLPSPQHTFAILEGAGLWSWLAFVLVGGLITALGESLRRARTTASATANPVDPGPTMERTTYIAFGLGLLLTLGLGVVAFRSVSWQDTKLDEHERNYRSLIQSKSLSQSLVEAQNAQRGYLLSGEGYFVNYYRMAATNAHRSLALLLELCSDHPEDKAIVLSMTPKVQQRLNLGVEVLEIRRKNGFNPALTADQAQSGFHLQEHVLAELAQLMHGQVERLQKSHQATDKISEQVKLLVLIACSSGFLVSLVAFLLINRDFAGQQRARTALREARDTLELKVAERTSELAQSQAFLLASEERLRLAATAAQMGTWERDLRTGQIIWSETLSQINGLEAGTFDGTKDMSHSLLDLEDHRPLREALDQAIQGNGAYQTEICFRRPDGSLRWALIRGKVIRDAEGKPERLVGVDIDITERKTAEEARLRAERLSESVLDALSANIAVLNHNGEIIAVNSAWENFYKGNACNDRTRPTQFGVGANYLDICRQAGDDKDAQEALRGICEVLNGSLASFSHEYPCHCPSENRWFLMNVTQLNHELRGAVVAHHDISKRRQAEESLRMHEAVLRETGSIAQVGGWSLDVLSGEAYWTEEVARIHDLPPDERSRQGLDLSYYEGDSKIRIEAALESALKQGQPYDLELEMTTALDRRKWIRTIGHPIQREGRVVRINGSFQDITTHKRLEQLEVAERRILEQIAAGAPLKRTLESIVDLVEAQCPDLIAAIMLLAPDRRHLRSSISRKLPEDYLQAVDNIEIGPCAGSCGTAAFRKESVIVENIATNPLWESFRHLVLPLGLRACWSIPILSHQRQVLGTFAIYLKQEAVPTEAQSRIFDLVTHTAAIALERHNAERELVRRENRLRAILESEPECVKLLAADGTLLEINPAGLTILRADSAAQLLGQNFIGMLQPEFREPCLTLLKRVMTGESGTQLACLNTLRGDQRWIDINAAPLRNEEGQVQSVLAVSRDVTERQLFLEALRESEMRLHAVWENSVDGMRLLDAEGRMVAVNEAYCQLTGMRRNQLEGQPFTVSYGGVRSAEEMLAKYRDRFSRRSIPEREQRTMTFASGRQAVLELSNSFLKVPGRPTLLFGIFRDITHRQRIETGLQESEERFRRVIENASDLISIISPEGIIRFQSPSSQPLLGIAPGEAIGHSVLEWIHPEDAARCQEALGAMFTLPHKPSRTEFRLRHQDGSWRTFEAMGTVMPSTWGESCAVINSRDVTESRKLSEQLRQSQKMEAIGQLSGGVAHDFNNLLTVIQGHAALAAFDDSLTPELKESLGEIQQAADRAANLTRQLLAFSRRQSIKLRDLDLNEAVINTTKMLQRLLGEDISIQVNYSAQAEHCHADPSMIDQILLNLAVNSRDAMPHGGRLTIETGRLEVGAEQAQSHPGVSPGSFVRLSVTDTGCGIAPENLPRIFEPFFTTKDVGKGTGLGLATVYGIVQQHGGWLHVESKLGQGTTFHIHLPRVSESAAIAGRHKAPEPAPGGKETVLLVEDDTAVRILAHTILSRLGYKVLEAENGRAALEIWSQHKDSIQLLLTDLIMPEGMNGRQLASRLQAEKPELKVIYASGYSADVLGRDDMLPPGVILLQKPYRPEQLGHLIRNCLDAVSPLPKP